MQLIDHEVVQTLERKHAARADRENAKRTDPPEFHTGQKVWYLRPEKSGEKLDSRWVGPCEILQRISQHGYEVQVTDQSKVSTNVQYLKPYKEDPFGGEPLPLYHHRRTVPDPEARPDEWEVDEV